MVQEPLEGYFPEPTKSILVISPRNLSQSEAFFQRYRLQVVMGTWYLRGFFGMETVQTWWLEEDFKGWRDLVSTLAGVALQYPHTAYAVLQNSLQQ